MIKIGVTGNIGAGKSEVENILQKKGYKTICADKLSHDLFEDKDIKKEIYGIFSTSNRTEIGNIIFKDPRRKKTLEEILHPKIKEKITDFFIRNKKEKVVFAFVPLLFEAKWEKMFDKIVLISANEETRYERILERNSYEANHALERIKSQMIEKEKIPKCNFVLKNEGTLEDLRAQTNIMLETLL